MAETIGTAMRLAIGAAAPTTKRLRFVTNGLRRRDNEIRGEDVGSGRDYTDGQIAEGTRDVSGQIVLEPRPDELAVLLPFILGSAAVGNVYSLAETLPECVFDVDYGSVSTEVQRYSGCKIARAVFSSTRDQPLRLTLDVIGKTGADAAFPAIDATLSAKRVYSHHQSVLSIAAFGGSITPEQFESVSLTIDNGLLDDGYYNSQTRTEVSEGNRDIFVELGLKFNTTTRTLFKDRALTGLEATLTYTRGGDSILFDFNLLHYFTELPTNPGRAQRVGWQVVLRARKAGDGTLPLVVTNVSA